MSTKITQILLWISIIAWSLWVGGLIYGNGGDPAAMERSFAAVGDRMEFQADVYGKPDAVSRACSGDNRLGVDPDFDLRVEIVNPDLPGFIRGMRGRGF